VFKEGDAFRMKNPNRKWPILMCIALSTKILHITDVSCRLLFDNPTTQDYKGVGSRRPGERSESMLHSFFLFCFLSSSFFNCSRTTVTATWKLRGLPWLAAFIRLSQESFKLLYLSEISEEGNSSQVKV
jgi:hypothetical protein